MLKIFATTPITETGIRHEKEDINVMSKRWKWKG